MSNGETALLTPYTKKWIGGIMGTVTGALLLVLLLNLGETHSHEDTTATLAQLELAVERRKEADTELALKVEAADIRTSNQKVNIQRVEDAVKVLGNKIEVLTKEFGDLKILLIKFLESK